MPWFHVNGIPVLAKDKKTAVASWKEGKLVKLHVAPDMTKCSHVVFPYSVNGQLHGNNTHRIDAIHPSYPTDELG